MFRNQFGDFIDLDPDSSNCMDPDTLNPDPHHWYLYLRRDIYCVSQDIYAARMKPLLLGICYLYTNK